MSKLSFMEQCAEKSKKEITKWLDDSHTREFQTKSKYIDMYNEKTELERILLQEKLKNKKLEEEILEYDNTMGMIEKQPIEDTNNTNNINNTNNTEYTNILPPMNKLSDYQVWKNEQDKIVYRKKLFKKIKNKDDKNVVEFAECCICYEEGNSFKIKTNCKHDICMSCILKINKKDCPMCREPFPPEITGLLNKEPEYTKIYSSQPAGIDSWFSWSGTPQSTGVYINFK